jgi:hypothetical protein
MGRGNGGVPDANMRLKFMLKSACAPHYVMDYCNWIIEGFLARYRKISPSHVCCFASVRVMVARLYLQPVV